MLDILVEALDPLQEGVVGGVAEDMDDEEEYRGQIVVGVVSTMSMWLSLL